MRLLLISLFFFSGFSFADELELTNSSVKDFVDWAATKLDKTIVIGTNIESDVTVYASYDGDEELELLLKGIILSAGYSVDISEKLIIISDSKVALDFDSDSPVEIIESIQVDAYGLNIPEDKVTSVFKLNSISAEYFSSLVKSIFPLVRSVVSLNTNSLVVSSTQSEIDLISRLQLELDFSVRQVVIEAVIAEISEDDFSNFGASLLVGNENNFDSSMASDVLDIGGIASLNVVSPSNLKVLISMVESSGTSNILSSPKILIADRETGSISVGQNVPFITGIQALSDDASAIPIQTIERRDVGVQLRVTPLILPDNSIRLQVYQEVSNVVDSNTASDIITNQRSINSSLVVKDGESIYLGGLKSNVSQSTRKGVPVISSIPVVGGLFRSRGNNSTERVLAVVLTARII